MTTKKTKPKQKTVASSKQDNINFTSDYLWTRGRCLEMAIEMFKQPFFTKEASAVSIISLADLFTTYIVSGTNAALQFVAPEVQKTA